MNISKKWLAIAIVLGAVNIALLGLAIKVAIADWPYLIAIACLVVVDVGLGYYTIKNIKPKS